MIICDKSGIALILYDIHFSDEFVKIIVEHGIVDSVERG